MYCLISENTFLWWQFPSQLNFFGKSVIFIKSRKAFLTFRGKAGRVSGRMGCKLTSKLKWSFLFSLSCSLAFCLSISFPLLLHYIVHDPIHLTSSIPYTSGHSFSCQQQVIMIKNFIPKHWRPNLQLKKSKESTGNF